MPAPTAEAPKTLLVTGATGFIGRYVVAALQRRFRIHALGRRAPAEARAPESEGITWHQVDLGDRVALEGVFRTIAATGGVDYVIHLAAYYDFAGREDPEYQRTNVDGLRHTLELCRDILKPRRFLFASSLAASDFPPRGTVLTEHSPLDGPHPYARSKREGEALVSAYREHFPVVIFRLGACYSDWCEFAPIFIFMGTWLSTSWRARILGGQGASALPYIHVREVVLFLARLLERESELGACEVLIASPDEATSHRQLFDAACESYFGHRVKPFLMPRLLVRPGMQGMDLMGRLLGERPFEQPWMADYIDRTMPVDASFTRSRLQWTPSPRFAIVRRMPFLVENLKTNGLEWHHRNLGMIRTATLAHHLRIFQLIEAHMDQLVQLTVERVKAPKRKDQLPNYQQLSAADLAWDAQQTFLHLKNAVRTKERGLFKTYCAEVAGHRFGQGFPMREVLDIVELKHQTVLRVLLDDPKVAGAEQAVHDMVNMAFRLGGDEIEDTFERLSGQFVPAEPPA